jgi:protease secretion system outer membrane protein
MNTKILELPLPHAPAQSGPTPPAGLTSAVAAMLLAFSGVAMAQPVAPSAKVGDSTVQHQSSPSLADHANRAIDSLYGGVAAGARTVGRIAPQVIAAPEYGSSNRLGELDRSIQTTKALNLQRLWEIAQINDRAFRVARAGNLGSGERLVQARSQMLPQVQFSASRASNSVTREGQNGLLQPQLIFDRYPSANENLQLRQPIFRPQQWFQVAQANHLVEDAQALLLRERQNLAIRAAASYFECLLAQDTLGLNLAQREFLLAQFDAAQKSLAAGVGTRTDVDDAKAKLDLNTAQELEARQYVDLTRRQLELLVGQPVGPVARLMPQRLPAVLQGLENLDSWVRTAEGHSPEVQSVQAQLNAARMEVSKIRAAHLPTVDLVASSQRSRSENTISPQAQYTNNSLAIQLVVPIYNGGLVNSQTRQASAEVERLTEQLESVKADLGVRIHKEYRGVTEGLARVRALEEAVKSSSLALDSAQKSFAAGVRTRLDVLNAQSQRMLVMRDLFQARYATMVATVRLEATAGRLDGGVMERVSAALQDD